jgi:hypothetical protein
MSVALPAPRRLPAVVVSHQLEARWVLCALCLTAVGVGLLSGHPMTGTLLGAAVLIQFLVRRRFQSGAAVLVETVGRGK